MASRTIFPPIVDSYMPAFKAGNTSCKVYFSLSKFNSGEDFNSVHISVVKQNTGMNVVKTEDNAANNRYRATGIIINAIATKVKDEDNLYYVEIYDDDLYTASKDKQYVGWIPGWIYKIQLRLSSRIYDGSIGQADWLNNNSSYFSEWSTVCIVKATGRIDYEIPIFGIDTRKPGYEIQILNSSTLQIAGKFHRDVDSSELIHSYKFILYDNEDNILEDSGDIYANQYQDNDSFNYFVKNELINNHTYKIAFKYITINKYEGGFYKFNEEQDDRFEFTCSIYMIEIPPCNLVTADSDATGILSEITSVDKEEDEGRIGLKFYSDSADIWSGNLCIRRADARDDYKTWTDIYIYICKQEDINSIPIIYDYTIESGVWYKYGVQTISANGDRGILNIIGSPIMRNFNFSFLLGKDNKQLKLMFDNSMNNFKYQISDSRIDPIGSKYTNIARNANTYYRTFPLNGLISFWMDEENLFCSKKEIYKYEDVLDSYNIYNTRKNIVQYDYIYERDFRDKVLEFLQDGELKLFKSPTEGNIIVRLMDVNCTPNQSLDRMLYSFTSNAYEMDKPTMENYKKYGFYSVGDYASEFSTYETKLGQLSIDFNVGDNVFQKIYEKYDSNGKNIAGYRKTLINIHHIKITFDDKPLRIKNSANEIVIGNNFSLNGKVFTVYNSGTTYYEEKIPNSEKTILRERLGIRMYEFDERLIYTPKDSLIILGDAQGKVTTVHATVDFLYDFKSDVYKEKEIQSRSTKIGIGQLFAECSPNENLFREIYYRHFLEWPYEFKRLANLSSIEIEANPGAAFIVRDAQDAGGDTHVVGITGQLRLYELSNITSIVYLGMQNSITGEIENKRTDVLLNYVYLETIGTYKKET